MEQTLKDTIFEQIRERELNYFTPKKLSELLQLDSAPQLKELYVALNELERDGKLVLTKKGSYVRPETLGYLTCELRGNSKGFAFALVPGGEDVFIPPKARHGAFHTDTVWVQVLKENEQHRREGEVVRVITRGTQEIVGTFSKSEQYGFVFPDDKRFATEVKVARSADMGAKSGDKVVVNITGYPTDTEDGFLRGVVTEIIGSHGDPWLDILSIMRAHNIKEEFPEEVTAEAVRFPQEVPESALSGRTDFRNDLIITIDGEDAKDLDDAVSVRRNQDGSFYLAVHIADVSEYVKARSALDKEALERGTSVYFPERAIPMLPRELSNGICSLNENVNRLTLSAVMTVNGDGKVTDRQLTEGVIKTRNRMTYTDVTRMLEGDAVTLEKYAHLVPLVQDMAELTKILQRKRTSRGSIDFDMPECKIVLDEMGKTVDVLQYERTLSHRMIEEFMILANETVAEYMHAMELPFLYRIHENPNVEKMENFRKFLSALGLSLKTRGEIHSRQLLDLLQSIEDSPVYPVVNRVMLRSMQKAKYAPDNVGHFGLASKCYCHFTSPIRRYPDLMVHRIIKSMLHGELSETAVKRLNASLYDIAAKCNEREKLADETEREVDDLKKAEFMLDKVGESFPALISGVTNFGIFCELKNTVEGLIRVDNLPKDVYNYMENIYSLVGSKRTFRLGDSVQIKVDSVNMDTRRVEFVLDEVSEHEKKKRKKSGTCARKIS